MSKKLKKKYRIYKLDDSVDGLSFDETIVSSRVRLIKTDFNHSSWFDSEKEAKKVLFEQGESYTDYVIIPVLTLTDEEL